MQSSRPAFLCALLTAWFLLAASPAVNAQGQDKTPPWTMKLGELRGPASVWPDENFSLTLPVQGGLKGETCTAALEAVRVADREGKAITGEEAIRQTQRGVFESKGSLTFTFDVHPQTLRGADKDRAEGTWEFRVKVPRHPKEKFDKPAHESNTVKVRVVNKKLRILLFIDGPTREYQFVRNLLVRRGDIEVYIYAKSPGFNPDVEGTRTLKEFPSRLGPDDKDRKGTSLSSFDLVIAFDPDWKALKAEPCRLLERWVSREGGGLIFAAGPIHTQQLADNDADLQPLRSILPVTFNRFRIADKPTRAYALTFTPAAKTVPFLKVDASGDGALAGWDSFFWGDARKSAKKSDEPQRGMYSAFPLADIAPSAKVLATFAGPKESRIRDGRDELPYLVTMPYGSGKSMFIGSGETWRLRQFKEAFHDRFWIQLARFMTADNSARGLPPPQVVPVLIIDGDPDRPRDANPDSFFVKAAIEAIPAAPYEVVLAHELSALSPAKVLETQDLSRFGAILLLNVRDLRDKQLANLEKYAANGGGVGFFLGPKVSASFYNSQLFKEGKGLFPMPLESTYYPPKSEPALKREATGGDMVLLRFDLFPDVKRYPILGPIFQAKESRGLLTDLPIRRYFKVPRETWKPDPARVFELATLPNDQPVESFRKSLLQVFYSQEVKAIFEDPANKKYVSSLTRHRTLVVVNVAPSSMKKNHHLAEALEKLLYDRGRKDDEDRPDLTGFWASMDTKVQKFRAQVADLLHQARYGDPLIVASRFEKGRVLAVTTSAGPDWNDWASFGKCLGSFVYQPFIWESVNYLSGQSVEQPRGEGTQPRGGS